MVLQCGETGSPEGRGPYSGLPMIAIAALVRVNGVCYRAGLVTISPVSVFSQSPSGRWWNDSTASTGSAAVTLATASSYVGGGV